MSTKIKWGIIGLGNIANTFTKDLLLSKNAILHSVASRNGDKAKAFAEDYNAIKYYDSYEKLAEDSDIDVVYIATPHAFHFEHTMLCLKNNKAVLCEKPMALNKAQVSTMIKEARNRNLFLMEGIWTRFIPATEKLLELIKNDSIGDVIAVRADFGFTSIPDFDGRLYNKKLGGGALLDIGIYPIYLSLLLLGLPTDMKVMARMTETDVDSYCSMLFSYKNNAIANLEATIEGSMPTEAFIYGTKGQIKLHREFFFTEKLTLTLGDKTTVFDVAKTGTGYFHEIEEANHCLMNGLTESKKVPLDLSLKLISIIDEVKSHIGLKYDA